MNLDRCILQTTDGMGTVPYNRQYGASLSIISVTYIEIYDFTRSLIGDIARGWCEDIKS